MRLVLPTLALAASTALSGCGVFQMASRPHTGQVTLRVADAAMAAGAPDMALRVAEIVLQKHPDDVAAMVAKADALYAMGLSDAARASYRQAVTADPRNAAAQIGLGRTLVRSDPKAAEAAFAAAVVRVPDDVLALNDLGIARDMQGNHAGAQEAYRRALAVAPDSSDVQTNLGLSLALSGDRTKAVKLLQPLATAEAATSLQRADLALAQGGGGAGVGSVDTIGEAAGLAIEMAPRAVVRRDALAPVIGAAGGLKVEDAGLVVADPRAGRPVAGVQGQGAAGGKVGLERAPSGSSAGGGEPVVGARGGVVAEVAPPRVARASVASAVAVRSSPVVAGERSAGGARTVPSVVRITAEAARIDPAAVMADVSGLDPAVQLQAQAAGGSDTVAVGAPTTRRADLPKAPATAVASLEHVANVGHDGATITQTPGEAKASAGGYFVQMAALDSPGAASAEWQKMQGRWPALLGDRTPAVQQAEVHDRTYWRLRTGLFSSMDGASDFCMRLRAGGSNCWIVSAGRE